MKIAIVGTGYVGLVTGTCFADMGIDVTCIDIDKTKIENLRKGIIPIYEPGLESLVSKNTKAGRLHFETDLSHVVNNCEIIFIAVGTPPDEDGSADLKYVLEVAKNIGQLISDYTLIVTKSTVPVGTAEKVRTAINDELRDRELVIPFDIASNPEFLKEGAAIKDFMSPDRVVVGVDSEKAKALMTRLYRPFLVSSDRMIITDIPSAEMIKYAANAMLATRISFMNDIANLCDLVGANVNMVRKGIGSDVRIGTKFLYPGCGYGGSCFPKDVKALIRTAEENGYEMRVLKAVEAVNQSQKQILFKKLSDHFGGQLHNKTIAVWGLSFKPETDDMREAPSLYLIDSLLNVGADIRVYDPVAIEECRRRYGKKLTYCTDMYDAATNAHAIILVTEWKEFRVPAWTAIRKLMATTLPPKHSDYSRQHTADDNRPMPTNSNDCPLIIDGRNIYDRNELQTEGFTYIALGK